MTISTSVNTKTYTGDNVTDTFSFPYLFYDNSHMVVKVDGATKTLNTDYTLTGVGESAGGSVIFTAAPATGASIVIQRVVPYTQETDLENFDGNPADVTEKQFDLNVMIDQQLFELAGRSVVFAVDSGLSSNEVSGTLSATSQVITATTSGLTLSTVASLSNTIDTTFTSLADNDLLQYNSSSGVWENVAPGSLGILAEVSDDTSPQLGGNLDVNSFSIISASNGDIAITPNGTGSILLDGLSWPQADGTSGQVLSTDGAGQLSFSSSTGFASSDITGQTEAVIAVGDYIVWSDVSDSNNLKKDTVQGVLDLVPGDLFGKTDTTIAAGDKISFADVSDSNNPKTDTVQGIIDLFVPSTTFGAVGTYSLCKAGASVNEGQTTSGANLTTVTIDMSDGSEATGSTLSGTWRNMGANAAASNDDVTLFVRTV